MKYLAFLLVIGGTSAFSVPPKHDYSPATGQTYDSKNCVEIKEVIQVDRCKTETVRECTTNQTMSCQRETYKNCKPRTVNVPETKCYDVTTKDCYYEEKVDYEVVDTYFPKQVCYTDKAPVCNTVYRIVNATSTREVCSTYPRYYCNKENKVIEDKVCKTEVRMDCQYSGEYTSSSTGGYTGNDGYDSKDGYETQTGYDSQTDYEPAGHCQKKLETKCYNQPRTVQMENCYSRDDRACEYVNEPVPRVVYEDECRDYEKRYCKMEQRPQKKQIKKYVYNLRCDPKTIKRCIQVDYKKIVPYCEPSYYNKCQVYPHEHCYDVPKKYCYKEPVVVKRQKCEPSDYSTPVVDTYTSKHS